MTQPAQLEVANVKAGFLALLDQSVETTDMTALLPKSLREELAAEMARRVVMSPAAYPGLRTP